jgi:hypothetical protein
MLEPATRRSIVPVFDSSATKVSSPKPPSAAEPPSVLPCPPIQPASAVNVVVRIRTRTSFVARLKGYEARRGKRAKKPQVYPLRYTEDFFAKFDEVAARISSTGAEDIFETGSTLCTLRRTPFITFFSLQQQLKR